LTLFHIILNSSFPKILSNHHFLFWAGFKASRDAHQIYHYQQLCFSLHNFFNLQRFVLLFLLISQLFNFTCFPNWIYWLFQAIILKNSKGSIDLNINLFSLRWYQQVHQVCDLSYLYTSRHNAPEILIFFPVSIFSLINSFESPNKLIFHKKLSFSIWSILLTIFISKESSCRTIAFVSRLPFI